MATTFADLEARVRGLDSRAQRAEEDITSIINTVVETRDDVKVLKRDGKVLKGDGKVLKGDVAVLKDDVAELKGNVTVLKDDVAVIKDDVTVLKDDTTWLKRGLQALLDHNGIDVGGTVESEV